MNCRLLQATLVLLAHDKGVWRTTSVDTDVGYEWMCKLSQGRIADPGVRKIERLHDYLARKYPHLPRLDNRLTTKPRRNRDLINTQSHNNKLNHHEAQSYVRAATDKT